MTISTRLELLQRRILEEHAAHMPDGPEKDVFMLQLSVYRARDEHIRTLLHELDTTLKDAPANKRERADKRIRLQQRVEQMYLDELALHGERDGTVEREILEALYACFAYLYQPERVNEFFVKYIRPKNKRGTARSSNSTRPRSFLTDKKAFVEAFFASGQTKYAFTKKVAKINAALPEGKRFGCNSTTQPDVETQLERAIERWGTFCGGKCPPGQK
jgi:hypothetical protein